MKNNYILSLFLTFFVSVLAAQNGQDSVVYTLADTVVANQYHKEGNVLMGNGEYDEPDDRRSLLR